MMLSKGTYISGIFTCCEMILALAVFPVPGGPSKRITFDFEGFGFFRVCFWMF